LEEIDGTANEAGETAQYAVLIHLFCADAQLSFLFIRGNKYLYRSHLKARLFVEF
jgi:hypothetical protein